MQDESRTRFHPNAIVMDWQPRLARDDDILRLEALIPISVKRLQAHHYSRAQMEAALGSVFGVDRQLIRDGTYFVVEGDGEIIGWRLEQAQLTFWRRQWAIRRGRAA
jgi:hypothetical protein